MQRVNIKRIPRTSSLALKRFSAIASFVFHPLLIVSYTTALSFYIRADGFSQVNREQFRDWLGILFLSTVLFPFLVIMILRLTHLISDAYMHAPRDRVLPLAGTLICYAWAFYFFSQKDSTPLLMRILLLGAVCSVILDFIINLFYKVSVHTTAAAMLPGNMLVLLSMDPSTPASVIAIAFSIALMVGLIRWWLGAHTLGQILLGYTIGISMQWFAYLVLNQQSLGIH